CVGTARPPTFSAFEARMTPTSVADTVDPSARITEFRPLDAAVSLGGTARMISVGIAEYANPTPTPTRVETSSTCHSATSGRAANANATVMIAAPRIRLVRGPRAVDSRAATGERANI